MPLDQESRDKLQTLSPEDRIAAYKARLDQAQASPSAEPEALVTRGDLREMRRDPALDYYSKDYNPDLGEGLIEAYKKLYPDKPRATSSPARADIASRLMGGPPPIWGDRPVAIPEARRLKF